MPASSWTEMPSDGTLCCSVADAGDGINISARACRRHERDRQATAAASRRTPAGRSRDGLRGSVAGSSAGDSSARRAHRSRPSGRASPCTAAPRTTMGLARFVGALPTVRSSSSFTSSDSPELSELVRAEGSGALDEQTVNAVVAAVAPMLGRFESSELAAGSYAIRRPSRTSSCLSRGTGTASPFTAQSISPTETPMAGMSWTSKLIR